MELGQYQLQIFVSLVVILAAAFVALICDFLKGNNEQLRELTIELKVRREEDQKRSHLLTPSAVAPAVAVPDATASKRSFAAKDTPVAKEKKRTVNAEALAAMERGAALASSGGRPRSAPAAAPISEPQIVVQQETAKPVVATAAKKDWGSLLSRNAPPKSASIPVIPATAHSSEPSLPAGFQAGLVLNRLVQSRRPISGLVVSIGVNATRNSEGALPESVTNLVQSLIGPDDFAAQSAEDEFLLIYPEERGASAQRRLSQIAQQLWDFQLRSLGSFQILFSWGGVEVHSESIEEAIASASERMQETKRGRKLLTMASPMPSTGTPLRRAV